MVLHLFSWNVNGLRAVLRKGALQQFLKNYHPDILCLQEIKCKPDQLTPLELAELEKDYQIFWHPAERPGYSGTAVLVSKRGEATVFLAGLNRREPASPVSPSPNGLWVWGAHTREDMTANEPRKNCCRQPRAQKSLFDELTSQEGRVLALDFGSFYLVNVYTPNSKPDLSRLELRHDAWDPEFKNLLKRLEKDKPVITCGDFNAAHKEIDLARPATNHHNAGFTDEEREGITNLLSAGFLDTFREIHGDEQRYTWWSHWGKARENNVGWRIDYFFISNILKPSLKDAEIYEQVQGSDHCPISIVMELN